MTERKSNGRFAPGVSGNPEGGRKRKTAEQKLLEAIAQLAPAVVERGLIAGMDDNAVLAASLNYLTECMKLKNLEFEAQMRALQYTAAGGTH